MKNNIFKYTLIGLFSILYLSVGFVSVYHSISFFELSNQPWLALILACAFEIGQAAVLFYVLISKDKQVIMGVLTLVQILGNVYSSYSYMMINNTDLIKYFTDSVLFFVQDPNPIVNHVMISYITGAILPVVALCMTSMIVNVLNYNKKDEPVEIPQNQEEQVFE